MHLGNLGSGIMRLGLMMTILIGTSSAAKSLITHSDEGGGQDNRPAQPKAAAAAVLVLGFSLGPKLKGNQIGHDA